MTYTQEQVGQILAGIKTPSPDQETQMTPNLLSDWIMSTVRRDRKHEAFVVLGPHALSVLSNQSWFLMGFDTTGADTSVGWLGSIFGSQVFVATTARRAFYGLQSDCLYVVSGDGEFSSSARIS